MRVQIIAALLAALVAVPAVSPAAPASCAAPSAGWMTSRPDKSEVVNTIVIHNKAPGPMVRSSLPTWNGAVVNAGQIHEYVSITKQMNPVPTLLLVVSPHADCEEVKVVRKIVDDALDCGTDRCVEVAP